MTSSEIVGNALTLARERLHAAPDFQIYQSIVAQLEYLQRVLSGEEQDRAKLKDIIVGHYAVREIEESDPEFANLLAEVQSIATKMFKGLKV